VSEEGEGAGSVDSFGMGWNVGGAMIRGRLCLLRGLSIFVRRTERGERIVLSRYAQREFAVRYDPSLRVLLPVGESTEWSVLMITMGGEHD
jgi:hypothetical protein